ncbi:hypothetical protein PUN28_016808 [Cardiocondyla obscurior]|uniref:Uncharacterized protein n=1 Tax=Cardiocondyla obscurior TaxID=286306 RepID=A0AAW2ENZ5_9HYME
MPWETILLAPNLRSLSDYSKQNSADEGPPSDKIGIFPAVFAAGISTRCTRVRRRRWVIGTLETRVPHPAPPHHPPPSPRSVGRAEISSYASLYVSPNRCRAGQARIVRTSRVIANGCISGPALRSTRVALVSQTTICRACVTRLRNVGSAEKIVCRPSRMRVERLYRGVMAVSEGRRNARDKIILEMKLSTARPIRLQWVNYEREGEPRRNLVEVRGGSV